MSSIIKHLKKQNLINPPHYVHDSLQYEVMMGSIAYGVSSNVSDIDVYGFCIPNKDIIFPHLKGEIRGFGRQIQNFDQYQQHHVIDPSNQKEYDMSIYNIVKYFQLVMDNNPNMIDSLFVPRRCILYTTKIGEMVRERRKDFLHKGCFHKLKSYAFSQMHKMRIKNPEGKRKELIEKYGYDVKFAYHVVRLLNECEQILIEHDLDLERNREQLKDIRNGQWTMNQIEEYFYSKEKQLEELYIKSDLPHSPDEDKIKELLLNCLEEHFGTLDGAIVRDNNIGEMISELETLIRRYR